METQVECVCVCVYVCVCVCVCVCACVCVCVYPVSDCRPAPMVDRRAPIRITHLDGHANKDTVNPSA